MKLALAKALVILLSGIFVALTLTNASDQTVTDETNDGARSWIEGRPEIFQWPRQITADKHAGDCNNDGGINILDITFSIAFLYRDGRAPADCPRCNVNNDSDFNILDITFMINYLYKGGPPPEIGDC